MTTVRRCTEEVAKTCGNCQHYEVLFRTPKGRPQKGKYGQCNGTLTLIAPMAYRVEIHKSAAWADADALKCPTYEAKHGS